MKKITSKKAAYWLLGETAGRTSVAAWKWLWGLPIESGGKIAENVAKESVISMQESIAQLKDAVAKIAAAHGLAKRQYELKTSERNEAEQQAKIANSKGNKEAARLAITKAIAIEKILPQLSDRDSPIQNAKVTVKLPESLAGKINFFTSYTDDVSVSSQKLDSRTIQFVAQSPIPSGEELKVKVSFPNNILDMQKPE